jgi:WD40 repeat protein
MLFLRSRNQDVTTLAFSPDGTKLATGGTGKRVDVWDLAAGAARPLILPPFKVPVAWVGFTPDGLLVAASGTAQFQTHNPATGYTVTVPNPEPGYVDGVVLTPDGGLIATAWQTRRWDLPGVVLRWSQPNADHLTFARGGAALLPGGRVAAAFTDRNARTWFEIRDTASGDMLDRQLVAHGLIHGLRTSPDGGTLLYLRELVAEPHREQTGTLTFGPPDAARFEHLPGEAARLPFTVAEFHPSGRWAATAQGDGTVRVFDVPGWREVRAYQWPVGWVRALAFDRDGARAAAGGDDGRVVVWDLDL